MVLLLRMQFLFRSSWAVWRYSSQKVQQIQTTNAGQMEGIIDT